MKGIELAFIYGSFAKREESAQSDIDLLVVGTPDDAGLTREIGKLEKKLKREINYTLFKKAEFKQKIKEKNSFVADLLHNPRIFLIGDSHDL
jgi:predicted nucleotidyltransferase